MQPAKTNGTRRNPSTGKSLPNIVSEKVMICPYQALTSLFVNQ